MTPIERQILKNQVKIIEEVKKDIMSVYEIEEVIETKKLLKEESKEPCCEMPEEEPKKIVLAIYKDSNHKKNNIHHYLNPITGEKFDEVPEGFEVKYDE